MNDAPSISVIVPVHDGERFLAEALRSAIDQVRPPAEIIVVDDGSSDRSASIAGAVGHPVRVLSQARRGAAAARNLGVVEATGEMLAFLDADDLWTPAKLDLQVARLRDEPALDAVLGHIEQFVDADIDPALRDRLDVETAPRAGYHVGTMLIRRQAFLGVGPFDASLRSGEFIDWWARAMDTPLRYAVVAQVVMRRRIHGANHTLRQAGHTREYLKVARQALRRRQDPGA